MFLGKLGAQLIGEVGDNERAVDVVLRYFDADDSGERGANIEGLRNGVGNFAHDGLLLDADIVAYAFVNIAKADARVEHGKDDSVNETVEAAKVGANAALDDEGNGVAAERDEFVRGIGIGNNKKTSKRE